MGRLALYGTAALGVSIGFFILATLAIALSHAGVPENGMSLLALRMAGWGALASVVAIGIDFVFLAHRGRASREIRYDPMPGMKVGVGLTAYNDEQAIGGAVKDFKEELKGSGLVDLVVIDNNCKDRTAEVAKKAGARVAVETRQGYGYACMRALREASEAKKPDVIILCEGDGTFSAADAKKLLAYMENADLVVGTRTVVEVLDPDSQVDWFINWGNKFIARMLQMRHWGRVRLSDVGCTYRVIRRDALERIMPKLKEGGNSFSPHMILVALDSGLTVIEVPVTFRQRVGESKGVGNKKLKGFIVGLQMLWHIFTE